MSPVAMAAARERARGANSSEDNIPSSCAEASARPREAKVAASLLIMEITDRPLGRKTKVFTMTSLDFPTFQAGETA
jgi:hypothetical protein